MICSLLESVSSFKNFWRLGGDGVGEHSAQTLSLILQKCVYINASKVVGYNHDLP